MPPPPSRLTLLLLAFLSVAARGDDDVGRLREGRFLWDIQHKNNNNNSSIIGTGVETAAAATPTQKLKEEQQQKHPDRRLDEVRQKGQEKSPNANASRASLMRKLALLIAKKQKLQQQQTLQDKLANGLRRSDGLQDKDSLTRRIGYEYPTPSLPFPPPPPPPEAVIPPPAPIVPEAASAAEVLSAVRQMQEQIRELNREIEQENLAKLKVSSSSSNDTDVKTMKLVKEDDKMKAIEEQIKLKKLEEKEKEKDETTTDNDDDDDNDEGLTKALAMIAARRKLIREAIAQLRVGLAEKQEEAAKAESERGVVDREKAELVRELRKKKVEEIREKKQKKRKELDEAIRTQSERLREAEEKEEQMKAHKNLAEASNNRIIQRLQNITAMREQKVREQVELQRLREEMAELRPKKTKKNKKNKKKNRLKSSSPLFKLTPEEMTQVLSWLDLERNAEILQATDKKMAEKNKAGKAAENLIRSAANAVLGVKEAEALTDSEVDDLLGVNEIGLEDLEEYEDEEEEDEEVDLEEVLVDYDYEIDEPAVIVEEPEIIEEYYPPPPPHSHSYQYFHQGLPNHHKPPPYQETSYHEASPPHYGEEEEEPYYEEPTEPYYHPKQPEVVYRSKPYYKPVEYHPPTPYVPAEPSYHKPPLPPPEPYHHPKPEPYYKPYHPKPEPYHKPYRKPAAPYHKPEPYHAPAETYDEEPYYKEAEPSSYHRVPYQDHHYHHHQSGAQFLSEVTPLLQLSSENHGVQAEDLSGNLRSSLLRNIQGKLDRELSFGPGGELHTRVTVGRLPPEPPRPSLTHRSTEEQQGGSSKIGQNGGGVNKKEVPEVAQVLSSPPPSPSSSPLTFSDLMSDFLQKDPLPFKA